MQQKDRTTKFRIRRRTSEINLHVVALHLASRKKNNNRNNRILVLTTI